MEIEGFSEIISTIMLAKELHDIGRYDIVQTQFFDTLCYDSWFENMIGVIASVFSWFHSDYDDGNETERMIFMDDVISDYFSYAWEYGRKHKLPHDENPYVTEAESITSRYLSFTYNMDWKLLGYTRSKSAAKKSKLIVYTCTYEFCEHDHLAYGLVQLYQWFSDKCAEFTNQTGVMAA